MVVSPSTTHCARRTGTTTTCGSTPTTRGSWLTATTVVPTCQSTVVGRLLPKAIRRLLSSTVSPSITTFLTVSMALSRTTAQLRSRRRSVVGDAVVVASMLWVAAKVATSQLTRVIQTSFGREAMVGTSPARIATRELPEACGSTRTLRLVNRRRI